MIIGTHRHWNPSTPPALTAFEPHRVQWSFGVNLRLAIDIPDGCTRLSATPRKADRRYDAPAALYAGFQR